MDMAYADASMADEGGASLRFVRGFDITNNRFISRFDVLWGAAVTRPGLGRAPHQLIQPPRSPTWQPFPASPA
jgi:hypothetical protein